MVSTSSDKMAQDPSEDKLLRNYDEYEDSVTEMVWSQSSPWTFASLSYNGHMIINTVPPEEQYKLLL